MNYNKLPKNRNKYLFNLYPINSSLRTIVISYDSLLESQCDRNFELLHTFQLITAQFNSEQFVIG